MGRQDTFFDLARRFVEWDGWHEQEYDYKLALGHRLAEARETMNSSDGDDWAPAVLDVMKDPTNNVVDWRDVETFTKWMAAAGAEELGSPFEALWSPGTTSPRWRMADFLAALPPKAARTRGVRLNVAAFLMGGCGVEEHPPIRITLFGEAWAALRYPVPKSTADPAEIYDQALRNFDRVVDDAADRGLELRDRLDAQGLVWSVMHWDADDPFIRSWPDEDRTRLIRFREA